MVLISVLSPVLSLKSAYLWRESKFRCPMVVFVMLIINVTHTCYDLSYTFFTHLLTDASGVLLRIPLQCS